MYVEFKPSTRKTKKMMAVFYDKSGRKLKTTHFGAKGMSDYTIHKDEDRMKRYLARHKKEDWSDPTRAGTLSRYILWGVPDLEKSIKIYLKIFNLERIRREPS